MEEEQNTTTPNAIFDKSLSVISHEIHTALTTVFEDPEELKLNIKKLILYQYVDEIYKIQRGRYIRWITKTNVKKTITNGSIVIDIKFLDTGTHLLCKNNRGQMIQIKFDSCLIFQKLSPDEILILSANNYL
jgi:hypothetical protein